MAAEREFPCALTLSIPLPSARLAHAALSALAVDAELSPLVRRSLALGASRSPHTVLQATYRASTNRMLRVAVNGFLESLGLVLRVMEQLDVDVVDAGPAPDVRG